MTDRRDDQFKRTHWPEETDTASTAINAPDLTRSIMGRLGYMRVPAHVARRRRRMRVLRRTALVAAMAAALGVSYRLYEQSTAVRRPAELTVPGAIIHDAQQSQMRINTVLERLRLRETGRPAVDTQPPPSSRYNETMEPMDPTRDEQLNRSAVAPFKWV